MVEVSVGRLPEGAERPEESSREAHRNRAEDRDRERLRRGDVGSLRGKRHVGVDRVDLGEDLFHGVSPKRGRRTAQRKSISVKRGCAVGGKIFRSRLSGEQRRSRFRKNVEKTTSGFERPSLGHSVPRKTT